LFARGVATNNESTAALSVFAAAQAVRRALAPIRKQRHARRRERFDFANRPVATFLSSLPAGIFANAVLAHAQRISVLERFRGCVETVRHVRMGRAHAVQLWPRTHSTGD